MIDITFYNQINDLLIQRYIKACKSLQTSLYFVLFETGDFKERKSKNLHYSESLVLSLLLNAICGWKSNRGESKNIEFSLFYKLFLLLTELAYISLVFASYFFILNVRIYMYLKLECCLKKICIF